MLDKPVLFRIACRAEELIEEIEKEVGEIRTKDLRKVAELPPDERKQILDRLRRTVSSLDFLGWTLRDRTPERKN